MQAETIHIDLSNKPAWYRKINPRGLVPALVHNGKTLTESLDLCQYCEDQFPGPALMPAAPEERREAERLIGRCDQFVSAVSGGFFFAQQGGHSLMSDSGSAVLRPFSCCLLCLNSVKQECIRRIQAFFYYLDPLSRTEGMHLGLGSGSFS